MNVGSMSHLPPTTRRKEVVTGALNGANVTMPELEQGWINTIVLDTASSPSMYPFSFLISLHPCLVIIMFHSSSFIPKELLLYYIWPGIKDGVKNE